MHSKKKADNTVLLSQNSYFPSSAQQAFLKAEMEDIKKIQQISIESPKEVNNSEPNLVKTKTKSGKIPIFASAYKGLLSPRNRSGSDKLPVNIFDSKTNRQIRVTAHIIPVRTKLRNYLVSFLTKIGVLNLTFVLVVYFLKSLKF